MAAKEPMSGTPDPVVDAYKPGIDRTLIRENLKRTPEERIRALQQLQAFAEELRRAGKAGRPKDLEAVAELELIRDEKLGERSDV
jgi:hypothetical protein